MNDTFVLLLMFFFHIVDDYYLQGILASMKQSEWWKNQKEYSDMYKNDYVEEYNQELIDQVNKRKMRQEDLPIKEQFKMVFEQYKRKIQEKVLFDILTRFYFADWTRQCDYENMTQEELIQCMMDVCKKIEKDYKYSVDDDLYPMPWGGDDYDL